MSEERLPPGAVVKPDEASRQALADAIEVLTVADLNNGTPGAGELIRSVRDKIAGLVRNRLLAPLVDEWGNVVGHTFRRTDGD